MHHHVPLEIRWAAHRCGPYQKSVDPFSAPKPSSGLFRPLTSPTVRQPAPRKHRDRWRSSWIGVQAVLRSAQRPPLANPFLALLILRRTIMFPQLSSLHSRRWKLWTALPTTVFLASTCGYTSNIIEPRPLPRGHRDQSFVVTRASRPEINLFLRRIFDRVSSSPALCDQNSSCTEIRRHLLSPEFRDQSSIFHLSSTSVFCDFCIRCISP